MKNNNMLKNKTPVKSFGVYYMDTNKKIRFIRLKTIRCQDESLKRIPTFVDNFKDASKFINADSAKKAISVFQNIFKSLNFKYIDSNKV